MHDTDQSQLSTDHRLTHSTRTDTMSPFYLWMVVLLTLQNYVMSEDPCERNVIGAVGGAVTLQVSYTGVRKIIWTF
ncbi:unnamed protein product [Staurois parvus]|uniref:Uncharacterized protein n=2 Tax=Staurois parvus TaxID=386267 RepID=A0ABN9BPZ8_9NEOB|nr:unnamed protein product [Staurois parvus]